MKVTHPSIRVSVGTQSPQAAAPGRTSRGESRGATRRSRPRSISTKARTV